MKLPPAIDGITDLGVRETEMLPNDTYHWADYETEIAVETASDDRDPCGALDDLTALRCTRPNGHPHRRHRTQVDGVVWLWAVA